MAMILDFPEFVTLEIAWQLLTIFYILLLQCDKQEGIMFLFRIVKPKKQK